MTTPQGGNNSDSGVVRIKRNAVAGAGKPPADDDAASKPTDTSKSAGTGTGAAKSTGAKAAGPTSAGPSPAGAKSTGAKATPGARKAAGGGGPRRPGGGPGGPSGGRGGRRPAPVVVAKSRNWTAISLVTTAVVVFVAIVGYGVYAIQKNGQTFEDKADKISGIVDYRKKDPSIVDAANRNHVTRPGQLPDQPARLRQPQPELAALPRRRLRRADRQRERGAQPRTRCGLDHVRPGQAVGRRRCRRSRRRTSRVRTSRS